MAFISRECVTCSHPTKKSAGRFSATDEKGERFSGPMFECENSACPINRERIKTARIYTRRTTEINSFVNMRYNKFK